MLEVIVLHQVTALMVVRDSCTPDFSSASFALIRSLLVSAKPVDIPDDETAAEYIKNAWIQSCASEPLQETIRRNVNEFPTVGPLGSGYVPTQLQVDETRDWLLKVQTEISNLDSDIAGFRHATKAAKHTKQKLELVTKTYSCFVSPIRRVPSEIWHEIFLLVVSGRMDTSDSWDRTLHASNLQQVCRHWADMIEASPHLWSYAVLQINSGLARQLANQRLQLAKGVPLHILLWLPQIPHYEPSDFDDDEFGYSAVVIDWDEIDSMLCDMEFNMELLFAEYGSQCQELCLADMREPWLPVLDYIPAAQHLERLCMTSPISMIDSYRDFKGLRCLTLAKFPRLRHVTLSNLSILATPIDDSLSSHISSVHLTSANLNSVLKVLAVCQALDSVTLNQLLLPDSSSAELVCNMRSFTIIRSPLAATEWGQLFRKLTLPRLSRIELINDSDYAGHYSYSRLDRQSVPLFELEQGFVDLLTRSRCSLTFMSFTGVAVEEDRLLSIFRLTPGLTTLILRDQYTSMTEKILQSLICNPTSTEGPLLPRLVELEVPVCTSVLDLAVTVVESRRPSGLEPSSALTIDYLIRALVAPCNCNLCVDFEDPEELVAQRVDKLRQSGLRMSILSR